MTDALVADLDCCQSCAGVALCAVYGRGAAGLCPALVLTMGDRRDDAGDDDAGDMRPHRTCADRLCPDAVFYLCLFAAALARPLANLFGIMALMEGTGLLWMRACTLFVLEHGMIFCLRRRQSRGA